MSTTRNIIDGLRTIVDRMQAKVFAPDALFRGNCRWCAGKPRPGEERHRENCPFAALVDLLRAAAEPEAPMTPHAVAEVYSFCEAPTAGPLSRWHIRRLTSAGKKLGGGVDTDSLCGHVTVAKGGWDRAPGIFTDKAQLEAVACSRCLATYRDEVSNG